MVGWPMYSNLHELRALGLNRSQVARRTGLNIKTVNKYWDCDPEEFVKMVNESRFRTSKLDQYRAVITAWLQEHPDLSGAQIWDWLQERYPALSVSERSVRRYVARLRESLGLRKEQAKRQYQAVTDPPLGQQLQVDFGETAVNTATGGTVKLRVIATVMSNSRYKWGQWSARPFSSLELVRALLNCFRHMGGVPAELVFDQDRLLAVSENYGDIIYTEEFERFKQLMGFRVRLCRASDPESKGRIEAVIKYIKGNFARHRVFKNLENWNQSFHDWLARTANQKEHGITKKVPAHVFAVERQHLRPIPITDIPKDIVTRAVRKDNTILYRSNRYSVPLGTYEPGKELEIKVSGSTLTLWDPISGKLVAEHSISIGRGQLVQNRHHLRDTSLKIEALQAQAHKQLGASREAGIFLTAIRAVKPRYVRDQFSLLIQLSKEHPLEFMKQAIMYCLEKGLYSAIDCREVVAMLQADATGGMPPVDKVKLPKQFRLQTEHRSLAAYTALVGGENDE